MAKIPVPLNERIFNLLVPLEKVPKMLLAKKEEFLGLAGAVVASLFVFKLLMRNLVASLFELLMVTLFGALVAFALMRFFRLFNQKAKDKVLSGVAAMLALLMMILLLL